MTYEKSNDEITVREDDIDNGRKMALVDLDDGVWTPSFEIGVPGDGCAEVFEPWINNRLDMPDPYDDDAVAADDRIPEQEYPLMLEVADVTYDDDAREWVVDIDDDFDPRGGAK